MTEVGVALPRENVAVAFRGLTASLAKFCAFAALEASSARLVTSAHLLAVDLGFETTALCCGTIAIVVAGIEWYSERRVVRDRRGLSFAVNTGPGGGTTFEAQARSCLELSWSIGVFVSQLVQESFGLGWISYSEDACE